MRLAHVLVCHTVEPKLLFDSIPHGGEDDLWFTFLHSDVQNVAAIVRREMARRNGNIFPYMINRGLALSWNDAIPLAFQAGCEAFLLLNDDLFFYENAYLQFRNTIEAVRTLSRNVSHVTTLGLETGSSSRKGQVVSQDFACCAIMRETIDQIGYFDENFTPAYYEDLDYSRRAILAGMTMHLDQRCLVEHQRSSTTVAASEADRQSWHLAQIANAKYFERKWGGGVSTEAMFLQPFNCGDATGLITVADRLSSYR